MSHPDCPTRHDITKYLLGTLEDEKSEQLSDHLAGCPQCQAVADGLDDVSDPLVEMLRAAAPQLPYVDEPQCRESSKRLTAIYRKFPWAFYPSHEQSDSQEAWQHQQILGDYLVIRRIGGHQGAVYKALHTELGREVVLKMLPAALLADEAAAERFQREIEAIGRLDHPNIVRAYDARQVGGWHFLVMEYVDGCDVSKLLQHCRRLPIAEACELVRQAAVGLQYICQHGLVHRDLKPSNLMLTRHGHVKLLDLGLACFRRLQQPPASEATGPGVAVGTVDYMSPEQISDSRHVDIRTDIYSLGCTLYKVLAGRAPFETPEYDTVPAKLAAHLQRRASPIQQLRRDVPAGLAAVLARMLAKNPAERFDTPEQVAAVLQPFTVGANLAALLAAPKEVTPDVALTEGKEKGMAPEVEPKEIIRDSHSTRWFWEWTAVAAAVVVAVGLATNWHRVRDLWSRPTPRRIARTNVESEIAREATGFAVELSLDHPNGVYLGPPAGPDGQGERIGATITSNRSGYLYLLNQQADGTLVCLFPNMYQSDNKIQGAQPVTIPRPQGDFDFPAGPPYGNEALVALVTSKPLPPSRFGVASLTDQRATRIDRQAVERLQAELDQNPNAGAVAKVKLTIRLGPPADSLLDQTTPPLQQTPIPEAQGLEHPSDPTPPADDFAPLPSLPAAPPADDSTAAPAPPAASGPAPLAPPAADESAPPAPPAELPDAKRPGRRQKPPLRPRPPEMVADTRTLGIGRPARTPVSKPENFF